MHSYLVKLPTHLRSVHPVFHVSQLELVFSSQIPNRESTPPPPVVVDGNLEFEIEKILDSKLDYRRRDPLLYYVQWAGYEGTPEEFSWVPASDLENAKELVAEFHLDYPEKPSSSDQSTN